MHKILLYGVSLFLILSVHFGQAAEKAPQEVLDYVNQELVKWSVDPIIVKAVKEENAKNKTLEAIKAIDVKWQETPGLADYMKVMIESECGKHLRELQKSKPFFDEIFVMDNQGANVAMTDKTSDYWQGDEDKFIKSFNKGQGGIFIDDVKFDESSQSYLVQASLPIKEIDPETKKETVIGSITIGLNIDEFK